MRLVERIPPGGRLFGGVAGLTLLSRIPLLTGWYGMDPDAWRLAVAARHVADAGSYAMSRHPGYPLVELGAAPLAWADPVALNATTAVLSALGAGWLALALRRFGVRPAWLAALAAMATPVVLLNSVGLMDYLWSLAFVLAAMALLRWPVLAGVALGLATGARLTAAAAGVPLLGMMWVAGASRAHPKGAGPLVRFTVAAAVTAGVLYLPALWTYGPGFLRFYDGRLPLRLALHFATVEVWGLPGLAGLGVAAVALIRRGLRRLPPAPRGYRLACAVGAGLYGLLYLRLPLEAAYLIPAVPFVVGWLGLALPQRAFRVVCVLLLLSPLVLDLEAASAVPERLRRPALRLDVGPMQMRLLPLGPAFTERARMAAEIERVQALTWGAGEVERPAVVVAGPDWSRLAVVLGRDGGGLVFVDSLGVFGVPEDDPLSVTRPPAAETQTWPVYVLPGVSPPPEGSLLAGRRPRPWPSRVPSSDRL